MDFLKDAADFNFDKPFVVMVTDAETGKLIAKSLSTMEDIFDILELVEQGKIMPKAGIMTLELQLWFAVAKATKFVTINI